MLKSQLRTYAMTDEVVKDMNTNMIPYSTFEYRYRDGGNFKSWDFIILEGQVTEALIEALNSCLIDGMWFMANQVGLPDLFEGVQKWGQSDLDVSWHEFVELRPATADDISIKPCFGTLIDLLAAFKNAKGNWKLS